MRRVVLDASAALAILRDEPQGPDVERALRARVRAGSVVSVPAQFWLEVVNGLRVGRRLPGDSVLDAIHRLDQFDIETIEFDKGRLLLVSDATERHQLTAYDAEYLVLAEVCAAPLVTLDRELIRAAGPMALRLDDWHRLSEEPALYAGEVKWPAYAGAGRFLAKLRADALKDREAIRTGGT